MIRSTLSNNLNLSRCNRNLNLFPSSSSSSIPNLIRRASTTSIPLDSQSKSSTTSSPKPNSPYTIFDVQAKLKQRDRAATRIPVDSDGKLGDENSRGQASRQTDYVRDLAAQNLSERLLVSTKKHLEFSWKILFSMEEWHSRVFGKAHWKSTKWRVQDQEFRTLLLPTSRAILIAFLKL